VITRIAGNGRVCANPPNCGDGGTATIAQLGRPRAVAVDSTGNLYIADTDDDEVRRVG
jgi:glucose/arabinose dehydrogenase